MIWATNSIAKRADRGAVATMVTTWTSATFLFTLASAALAEPFSFRDIPLGISLAEFRRTPFPDEAKYPKSRVICSSDKETAKLMAAERPPLNEDQARSGVVACSFFSPSNGRLFRNAPDLANIGGYQTTFYFSPTGLNESLRQRLYLVSIFPRSEHFKTITDALTVKFGQPSERKTGTVQNRLGASFEDQTAFWTKDGSTILVKQNNGQIGQAMVMYFHNELIDATNAVSAGLSTENAKKL